MECHKNLRNFNHVLPQKKVTHYRSQQKDTDKRGMDRTVINRQGSHCIPRHKYFINMNNFKTKMKSVSLPLDVFGKFRSADKELTGEVLQYVLGYAIDGEQKHFTDQYKEMLFESLLEPVRLQVTRYSERTEQCQEMARERKKPQKSQHKKNVKVTKCDDNVAIVNDNVKESVDNVADSNNNVGSSDDDLSFATFMSIYEHQDKGGYDTESVWNHLDDNDKREAIHYVRQYVKEVPEVTKREWPSRFLSNRLWTKGTNN